MNYNEIIIAQTNKSIFWHVRKFGTKWKRTYLIIYRTDSDNRLYSVSSLTQLAAYFGQVNPK